MPAIATAVLALALTTPPIDVGWPPATPVEAERAANLEAYETVYLDIKDALVESSAGKWIAIVDGHLLPMNTMGGVEPADSLEQVAALADEAAPDAQHRFIFRIGEDGDVAHHFTMSTRPNIIGRQFLRHLGPRCWVAAGAGTYIGPRDAKDASDPRVTKVGGTSADGEYVTAHLGTPDDEGDTVDASFHVATGFSGYTIIDVGTAEALELALWEVPGAVRVEIQGDLRRARAWFRVDGAPIDRALPVAVRVEDPKTEPFVPPSTPYLDVEIVEPSVPGRP